MSIRTKDSQSSEPAPNSAADQERCAHDLPATPYQRRGGPL